MPLWKQSDDPWDQQPKKRSPETKESKGRPLDAIKAWNEDRKAAARKKEEAKRLPPEKCPWCGKDMEQGFLLGGRDGTRWYPGVYKFTPLRALNSEAMDVLDDGGGFASYKITWLCQDCKKAVFDMPVPPECHDYPYSSQTGRDTEEEQKEEESEE